MPHYPLEWHDMSEYLVHFTRDFDGRNAYENILSILGNRVLRAFNPFGIGRRWVPNIVSQHAVCLSEVHLHLVSRLAEKRGSYGIGFTKQFLLEQGGCPVWYVEHDCPAELAILQVMQEALRSDSSVSDPIWSITPYVDSTGIHAGRPYRFEWEREWRHVGHLSFTENDVAFLVIPENLHAAAHNFFLDALHENLGPAYFCPYIDPFWNLERVRDALISV